MKRLIAVVAAAMLLALTTMPVGAHETDYRCKSDDTPSVARGADAAAAEVLSFEVNGHPRCVVDPLDADEISGSAYVIGGTAAVPEAAVSHLDVIERFAGADRYETLKAVVEYVGQLRDKAAGSASKAEPEEDESETEPTLRDVRHSHCRRYNTSTAHLCDRRFSPLTYSHSHDMSPDCIDYDTQAAGIARHWHKDDGSC